MNGKKEKDLDSKKVRIGIVGSGFISQLCHIKNYSEIDNCEIVALAEIKPELRELVAKRYDISKTYRSHRELLEKDMEVEAVVIVTKRNMMGPIALDCINAGKPILTEKPMASTYKQAKKLVEAAKVKGVLYNVGYNKRYDEGVQKAKLILDQLLTTKELGEIIYVRAHRFSGTGYCNPKGDIKTNESYPDGLDEWPGAPEWVPDKWRSEYHQYLNTFCHNINLLRYFLESTPNIEYAELSKNKGQIVVMNFGDFRAILETKNYNDNGWDEITEIFFENGCLQIKTPPQQLINVPAKIILHKRIGNDHVLIPKNGWTWSFKRQADAFISDVNSHNESLSSGEDSLKDLLLAEKIWKDWIKQ